MIINNLPLKVNKIPYNTELGAEQHVIGLSFLFYNFLYLVVILLLLFL